MRVIKKLMTKEIIAYFIFGVLTTIVNLGIFYLSYQKMGLNWTSSTVIAWTGGVLFAFVVNKQFVFLSCDYTCLLVLKEFALFVFSRLISLAVELLTMWSLIELGAVRPLVAKIIVAVLVVLLNYILGKLLVFRRALKSID